MRHDCNAKASGLAARSLKMSAMLPLVRVCIVYDCLYPYTVGGAERWYRKLAERLAAEGHSVTYLTLRQWDRGTRPAVDPRIRVVAVAPRMGLYAKQRRRILPPLVFGLGVLLHLLRRGRRYDVVHTCAFPYFSLLAAAALQSPLRYRLVVDWWEVWSRGYWHDYLGRLGGWVGYHVQRRCVRVAQRAFCFSQLHASRLVAEGMNPPPTLLQGAYTGALEVAAGNGAEPLVVFAGRLIPEKRAAAVAPAVELAASRVPGLRGIIFGEGPDRPTVLAAIAALEDPELVSAPGFVPGEEVQSALRRACAMVLPSRREGYGMIVVEAAAYGTPSIVVSGSDNAALELIEDGVNGVKASSAEPADVAAAIVRIYEEGPALRERTREWFRRNAARLSLDGSLATVLATYARDSARR
jgi:glycosyltransferase involved in cell wall biosynthesis